MVELNPEKDEFLREHTDFSLKEQVEYPNGGVSRFYENGTDMVIIDEEICSHDGKSTVFSYMLITDKQNHYMHKYARTFRFLGYNREEINSYLEKTEINIPENRKTAADRAEQADASPLELYFETLFSNVYGMNALKYLSREYNICDETGNNFFLDYYIRTADGQYAVEENGVQYHHPQIIGEERYRNQLVKQNTSALWGIKLFRFSSEDCKFDERIEDDIKQYFGGDSSTFIEEGLKVNRKVVLYEHQTLSLEAIQKNRDEGIKAFLVVLPTASGKSKIVEEDIKISAEGNPDFKGLILVPGINIQDDWNERINESLPDLKGKIDVYTYAFMALHYSEMPRDKYNYIVVDEAHHAVAPALKRTIQYFDPDFLIGLTATDQRPDHKKLEAVFGNYNTSLSLREAMDKGVVARANVYRIETNLDLTQVRFNGKDYVNADLETKIRVNSRNELIVQVLSEYFTEGEAGLRQGVVFCVNVKHAEEMAKLLNKEGLTAASYTGQTHNPEKVMKDFKDKKIRFLCACSMLSEGWDYPELGILVMARPTLSKVLYLQQVGRGLRKTDTKKNIIVIDVVDEYGAMIKACNMHTIFANPYYVPFGDITKTDYHPGELIEIDGLVETIEKIQEVDFESFEDKYGDYLSKEQLAREFFTGTETITSWVKKGKITPSVSYKFGSKMIYLFSPEDVEKYRAELGIGVHNDETIKEDFFNFLEERDYALSYKMTFIISFIDSLNVIGDAEIDDVLEKYIAFYKDRIDRGLPVDRATCPYNAKNLEDKKYIRQNMLTNPFEKFERKRFIYYSKELGIISVNHSLFSQMTESDWQRVRKQMVDDQREYYSSVGNEK